MDIKQHIEKKELEIEALERLWNQLEDLHRESAFKDETFNYLKARISSKVAQCEISIVLHAKLLEQQENNQP